MSLLARYVLNDSSDFKKDISGKTNGVIGGTLNKAKIPAPGFSTCAEFNGTDNYIQIGRNPMSAKKSITVSWWGYMDDWSKYTRAISCTQGGGWNFERASSIRVACYIKDIGYKHVYDDTPVTSLKGWHLFSFTFFKGTLKFYRDGSLKQTIDTGGTEIQYNPTNSILIGAEAYDSTTPEGAYFKGCLSDVRIYSEALSASQIENMYKYPNSVSIENQGKKLLSNGGEFIESSTTLSMEKFGDIKCDSLVECYTFESAAAYTAAQCLEYSTRDDIVIWNDSDIINGEAEKNKKWIDGSIICLVIPCDDKTFYISYQTVVNRTSLRPLKLYNIQNNKGPFMALGKDKKIYFNEFIEC